MEGFIHDPMDSSIILLLCFWKKYWPIIYRYFAKTIITDVILSRDIHNEYFVTSFANHRSKRLIFLIENGYVTLDSIARKRGLDWWDKKMRGMVDYCWEKIFEMDNPILLGIFHIEFGSIYSTNMFQKTRANICFYRSKNILEHVLTSKTSIVRLSMEGVDNFYRLLPKFLEQFIIDRIIMTIKPINLFKQETPFTQYLLELDKQYDAINESEWKKLMVKHAYTPLENKIRMHLYRRKNGKEPKVKKIKL